MSEAVKSVWAPDTEESAQKILQISWIAFLIFAVQ